jgi:predicted regulator of Ras-like GTPase activity (Roadblock/LC7/MglB family)
VGGLFKNIDNLALNQVFRENLSTKDGVHAPPVAVVSHPQPVASQLGAYAAPGMPSAAPGVIAQPQAAAASPPQPPLAAPAATPEQAPGLLGRIDDQAIDRIFAENLGIRDSLAASAVRRDELDGNMAAAPPQQMMQPPPELAGLVPNSQAFPPPAAPIPAPLAPPQLQTPPPAQPGAPGAVPQFAAVPSQVQQSVESTGGWNVPQQVQQQLQQQAQAMQQGQPPAPEMQSGGWGAPAPQTPPAMAPQAPPAQQGGWNAPPVAAPPQVPPQASPAQQGGWNAPPVAPPQAPPQAPPEAAPQGGWGMPQQAPPPQSSAMERIFSADMSGAAAQVGPDGQKMNVLAAVNAVREAAEEVHAQGQAAAAEPVKLEGIGRLAKEDPGPEPTSGKIAQIGKFLLDSSDFNKLGNLASTTDLPDAKVRVLTLEAADEINKLLNHIATQPGVVGSVIVGHDGILIASNLPPEVDPESVGIWSLGIYVNTLNSTKKLGHNHLHQLVARSRMGYLVVADFGGGILVTVSNGQETDKLIPLMRSITQLVAQ